MIKKDSHGRGWEITYAVYIRDDEDEPMREVLAYVSSVIKMEKISLGKDEK